MADNLVYVSTTKTEGAEPALAEPVFIIEHDGKHYVTKAVWEYHAHDEATDEVKEGVGQVRAIFEAQATVLKAVPVPSDLAGMNAFVDSGPRDR